ncbi:YhgE/Pip domain-containing protein [Oceanobacillus sp. 1P07AA]|uniref:YhgE/Pip domain-containing protein n=1 Tax=Oceanobacillus sp. 1P07AA TaxID=3132293 RepID=UPI0039A49319
MKIIKWLWLTLAIFFFPVLITNAEANTSDSDDIDSENTEAGEVSSKNEVIYANLQAGGSLKDMYVVNAFELSKPGLIEDYGNYQGVKNLTDTSPVEQNDNKISMIAEDDSFYYQGNIAKELPWSFDISYYLDGKEMKPEEMIGESGEVEITIDVQENDIDTSAFFENYMLQISLPLSTDHFQNIEAQDATIANAGKNKQIAFTVMPEEEEQFSIKAQTDNFEVDGLEISALPSSMSIDSPDTEELTSEFDSLTDAVGDIDDGVGELNNGITGLASGLSELENGSSQYKNGMDELNQSSSQLTNASSQINDALSTIQSEIGQASGASGLEQLEELDTAVTEMASGLEELANGMDELSSNYSDANKALENAINQIPESSISESDIEGLYQSGADQEIVDELVKTYEAAQTIKGTYDSVAEAFGAVEPSLTTFSESTREVSSHLRDLGAGLEESMNQVDVDEGLNELVTGLEEMSANYSQFHDGLIEYTNGVNELANSYGDIHNGIGESADGAGQIAEGASELEDGTGQLYDATSEIPDEMQEEIDSMISQYDKSDFDPISFVSDKNDEVTDSVEFVISTDSLVKEEPENTEEETEEEKGFLEKLKDLFR